MQKELGKIMIEQVKYKQVLDDPEGGKSKELIELLPYIKQANKAAKKLGKDVQFTPELVKKLDPFSKEGENAGGQRMVIINVQNNESNYNYQWSQQKFKNRYHMI